MRLIIILLIIVSLWISFAPFSHTESAAPAGEIQKSETSVAPVTNTASTPASVIVSQAAAPLIRATEIENPIETVRRTAEQAAKTVGTTLGQYVRGKYQQMKNTEMLDRFNNSLSETLIGLPLTPEQRQQLVHKVETAYVDDVDSGKYQLDQTNFHDLPLVVRKEYSDLLMEITQSGTVDSYDFSGRLKTKWTFDNKQLNGPAVTYYDDGEIHFIDFYENGKRMSRKKYDREGKLEFEQHYSYDKAVGIPAGFKPSRIEDITTTQTMMLSQNTSKDSQSCSGPAGNCAASMPASAKDSAANANAAAGPQASAVTSVAQAAPASRV